VIGGIGRLFTAGTAGVIEHAAVVLDGETIAWTGREVDLPRELAGSVAEVTNLGGALVTPGLVDAHTHPLYGGDRFAEIALRSEGASYAEVAAAGGGIASSVAVTRATGFGELARGLRARLGSWLAGGTTTVEAKTGYHLEEEGELAAVALLADAVEGAEPGEGARGGAVAVLPAVEVTFLGGHAVPPEWSADPGGYARAVASWCPDAARAGARHADVFCDEGYFSPAEARLMLTAARAAGLIPRIHADELARTGGALLAAELGCASADHLLRIDEGDGAALAAAGVVATLAPLTALAIGRTPPARQLVRVGATIALGSDHNPGTCGATSMSLVVCLAVAELGLSVREALTAATAGGAQSLRLPDRGRVEPGLRADLVAWDSEHEGAFAWAYGLEPVAVWKAGARVAGRA
jgi:imidazolonepropionase